LGRLETIAEQFSAWQGAANPILEKIKITVFAGDHGVCQHNVSAFPQIVTTQMITNFLQGGAAISVLSRDLGAEFFLVNVGTVTPVDGALHEHPAFRSADIAPGTADFSQFPAMTELQLEQALDVGRLAIDEFQGQLTIGGDMGIGNTTSASAIYAATMGLMAAEVVGPGTGVDKLGIERKQRIIEQALTLHGQHLDKPYEILRRLGGLEIAALVAYFIRSAQRGIPVLVDGFIASAAALLAVKINPGVRAWLLFSHQSAEPAHKLMLDYCQAKPLLALGMRLGEGSGAAVAVPLLRSALSLHNYMATFTSAHISDKNSG